MKFKYSTKSLSYAVLIIWSALSCSQPQKCCITGQIHDASIDLVFFVTDSVGYGLSTNIDTVLVDSSGYFEVNSTHLETDALIIFKNDSFTKLTLPSAIQSPLHIDYFSSDSILINGDQSAFAQYYHDDMKYWKQIHKQMSERHLELAQGNNQSTIYHQIQDTITELRLTYLQEYFKVLNIDDQQSFIQDVKDDLMYSNLYYRMSGQNDQTIHKLDFYNTNNESSALITYSAKVKLDDERLFQNYFYRQFIHDFIMSAVRVENPNGDFEDYNFYLENGWKIIDKTFQNPQTNHLEKLSFVNELITTAKIFKPKIDIKIFDTSLENLQGMVDPALILAVRNNLKELKTLLTKIKPGAKAPNFILFDSLQNEYKLDQFEGKVLIIDNWASWCRPCIASFPKWNKVAQKFANREDIKFLTVSLDQNENKWKQAMSTHELLGLKLHAKFLGFDSPFAKSYEITSIPSYIAIDKNGQILSISSDISEIEERLSELGN